MAAALIGRRVYDNQFMFGNGVVLKHDAVKALIQWDTDNVSDPMWVRWSELNFEGE